VPGAELKDGVKPVETNANLYRFEVSVSSKSKADLTATQERVESSSAYLMNYSIEQLMYYRTSGAKLSDAVLSAFRKAQELQVAINTATESVTQLDTQRNEITRDQDRIRQNMSSIDRNSDYYNRLLKKLNDQETQVEQLDAQLRTARAAVQTAEAALNDYLANLNVE
jgi:chromosome segregation ATPase